MQKEVILNHHESATKNIIRKKFVINCHGKNRKTSMVCIAKSSAFFTKERNNIITSKCNKMLDNLLLPFLLVSVFCALSFLLVVILFVPLEMFYFGISVRGSIVSFSLKTISLAFSLGDNSVSLFKDFLI